MNAAERTKEMMHENWTVVTNPTYLESKFSGMSIKEIKEERIDKAQQLSPAAQQELSLRGDRTAFIEFHRYMYSLEDVDIQRLKNAMKQFVFDENLANADSIYCDQSLLLDAIDYHLCIRFDKDFSVQIADQIARHFRQNCKLAQDFPEINSEHLIHFAKNLMEEYSKKH